MVQLRTVLQSCQWLEESRQTFLKHLIISVHKGISYLIFKENRTNLRKNYNCQHRVKLALPDDSSVWVTTGDNYIPGRVVLNSTTPQSCLVTTPSRLVRRNRQHLHQRLGQTDDYPYFDHKCWICRILFTVNALYHISLLSSIVHQSVWRSNVSTGSGSSHEILSLSGSLFTVHRNLL